MAWASAPHPPALAPLPGHAAAASSPSSLLPKAPPRAVPAGLACLAPGTPSPLPVWERPQLQEPGAVGGGGATRQWACSAGARRGRREPYVEPTWVFDAPGDPDRHTPHGPGTDSPTAHPSTSSSSSSSNSSGSIATFPNSRPSPPHRDSSIFPARASPSTAAPPATLPTLSRPPDWSTPPGEVDQRVPPDHKSGYVALIGQPNAGKSTLLNSLIGQKLSIVTRKPQTTRHRILGLCSSRDYQIVLYDTPGVIPQVAHKLDDCMMQSVRTATINADCVVLVVDATIPNQKLEDLMQAGGSALAAVRRKPCLVVLNKKDQLKPGELAQKTQWYTEEAERCLRRPLKKGKGEGEQSSGEEQEALVLVLSAKFGHGMEDLMRWMVSKIPLGPAYYPKDVVSELPERFFVAEILREQLLLQYHQEVPYACQVVVRSFKERQVGKDYIAFDIMVERESQRGILLGKGGMALKALATNARLAIEEFLGREAYLEIVVKVKENWREDEDLLKQFGLNSQSRGDWY